jgi:hypothetical protein
MGETMDPNLMQKEPVPDLSGTILGTWRVLYEAERGKKRHFMCQCVGCGVRKFIVAMKFRRGYALRCPECRIRQEFRDM